MESYFPSKVWLIKCQLCKFFRTVASSETDVVGLAQLWSFPSNLLQEDPWGGGTTRVNHSFFRTVASSETDVARLAQLKKEASISETTFSLLTSFNSMKSHV